MILILLEAKDRQKQGNLYMDFGREDLSEAWR